MKYIQIGDDHLISIESILTMHVEGEVIHITTPKIDFTYTYFSHEDAKNIYDVIAHHLSIVEAL